MPGDYLTIEVNGGEAGQAAVSLLEHEGWGDIHRRHRGRIRRLPPG
jgi:hypothetical protein